MPENPQEPQAPKIGTLVVVYLLVLALILTVFTGWRTIYDADCMLRVAESLLSNGSIIIVDPKSGLEKVSHYGLGQSILFIPFVLLAKVIGGEMTVLTAASLLNPLLAAGIGTAIFRMAMMLGIPHMRSLGVALVAVFGTPLFSLTQYQFAEPAAGLALTLATMAVWRGRRLRSFAAAGALIGFAVLTKPAMLVTFPCLLIGILLLPREDGEGASSLLRRMLEKRMVFRVLVYGGGMAPFIVAHFAYNYARYQHLLLFNYPDRPAKFGLPLSVGLPGLLWSRRAGLFWFAPAAFLAVLLLPLLIRKHRSLGTMILLAFTAILFLHAKWSIWTGAGPWEPRFLVPTLPLLMLVYGLVADRIASIGCGIVALSSVGLNILGVLRDPFNTLKHMRRHVDTDLLGMQWKLLNPVDIDYRAFHSTSGTYWPTFTLFGVLLLLVVIGSAVFLAYRFGRIHRRAIGIALLLPLVYFGVRDFVLPYRLLNESLSRFAKESPISLERAAVSFEGRERKAAPVLRLVGAARVELDLPLDPGVYAISFQGFAPNGKEAIPFDYLVGFETDTLGSGKIAGSGPYEVASGSVKVNRRGAYHLLIGSSPVERTRQSRHQRLVIQQALLKTR